MRRLLVAYDGSDNAKRALQYVVDLARDTGIALQVHVVNVQHEPIIYGEYVTSAMIDELNNGLMAKARSVLDEAQERTRDNTRITLVVAFNYGARNEMVRAMRGLAEVLGHLAAGRRNAEIAAALGVSPRTVGHQVSAVLAKLGARSRTEAAALAHRSGLLAAEPEGPQPPD